MTDAIARSKLVAGMSVWILAVIAAVGGPTAAQGTSTPFIEKYIDRAQEALAAGDRREARHNIELVLERSFNHLKGTLLKAQLDLEDGKRDEAVSALVRIVEIGGRLENATPDDLEAVKRAGALLEEHDPDASRLDEMTAELRTFVLDEAERLIKAKLWISALKLVNRHDAIAGQSERGKAIRDRIIHKGPNDIAKEDIHGGLGPLDGISADWISKEDEKHKTWEKRWTRETEHYRVETNAGYEILVTACIVMEQFHSMYRSFYGVDEKRKIPAIPVKIFATQDAFKDYAPLDMKGAGGYYDSKEIVTYDAGFASRMYLWETLAHEASHQFTDLVTKEWQPTWMNEGTASFFEGVKILSNGQVVNNIIPRASRRLETFMRHSATDDRIKLRDLLTTQSGLDNYTGDHYAYGWALIYFLFNYTDDKGRPTYRDLLQGYMKAGFRKVPQASAHIADFEKKIVAAARHPSIKSLDAFESEWRAFMKRRHEIELGRVDPVPAWIEKARALMKMKGTRPRSWASEMIDRILARAPSNTEALQMGIDLVWKGRKKDKDRALDRCQRILDAIPAASRDKKQERVITGIIRKVDAAAVKRTKRLRSMAGELDKVADKYVKANMPRRAIQVLRGAKALWPEDPSYLARAEKLRKDNNITTLRWRLLFNERDIREWTFADMDDNTYRVESDELVSEYGKLGRDTSIDYRLLFGRSSIKGDYRFRARMSADAKLGCKLVGICFGIKDSEDFKAVIWFPEQGVLDLARFMDGGLTGLARKNVSARGRGKWYDVEIAVRQGKVSLSLAGKEILTRDMGTDATDGAIGLIMGGGKARFKHLRMLVRDEQIVVEGAAAH